MSPLLGCVADDFTGAADIGSAFARAGLHTALTVGSPAHDLAVGDYDAVVVALKTRSVPCKAAIGESIKAVDWLLRAGCSQFYFKYGSTFDSTPAGNIGPVTEALLSHLGEELAVLCPAFPATGRRLFMGHLFVHQALLNESGMERHPLNPMSDANLVRWLGQQSEGRVGLVDLMTVRQGAAAISLRLRVLQEQGCRHAVVDAVQDSDLEQIAAAVCSRRLVTGAAGLGAAVSARRSHEPARKTLRDTLRPSWGPGSQVVLAGSCSSATREQIRFFTARYPARRISAQALLADEELELQQLLEWVGRQAPAPCLIYSMDLERSPIGVDPDPRGGRAIEAAFGRLAGALLGQGADKIVVAGGETAGAVMQALNLGILRIGPQIDPGIPWIFHGQARPLALALKSGNFGSEDFFVRAFDLLRASTAS